MYNEKLRVLELAGTVMHLNGNQHKQYWDIVEEMWGFIYSDKPFFDEEESKGENQG